MQRIFWSHSIALLHYYVNTFCDKTNDPKSQNARTPETIAFWLVNKILHNNLCVYVLMHYYISSLICASLPIITETIGLVRISLVTIALVRIRQRNIVLRNISGVTEGGTFPANNCWSSRRLEDMSSERLQHVFRVTIFRILLHGRRLGRRKIVTLKTSWKCLKDMSRRCLENMYGRRFEEMSWRCLQYVL